MGGEALTLLAGAGSGFLFKLIGTIVQGSMDITKSQTAGKIELQQAQDDSADRASKRGGKDASWVRRFIVISILLTMVYFPFIIALYPYCATSSAVEKLKFIFFSLLDTFF